MSISAVALSNSHAAGPASEARILQQWGSIMRMSDVAFSNSPAARRASGASAALGAFDFFSIMRISCMGEHHGQYWPSFSPATKRASRACTAWHFRFLQHPSEHQLRIMSISCIAEHQQFLEQGPNLKVPQDCSAHRVVLRRLEHVADISPITRCQVPQPCDGLA